MTSDLLSGFIRGHYIVREWRHACAILSVDFPHEWQDIIDVLTDFRLLESHIATPGGGRSQISQALDGAFYRRGWVEHKFDTRVVVDRAEVVSPTHKVDCFKNEVALEIEWNNKTPFYDRDLNNFRLLFDLRAASVGVIITRSDELQDIFNSLGRGTSYGQSTTIFSKLVPLIEGGGGGGCPILAFGITERLFVPGA